MSGDPLDKPLNWRWPDVTLRDYNGLLELQGGKCAICRRPPKKRRLSVDHDHKTGRVRGLLCYVCNKLILGYYARPEVLRAAADYLERGQ